MPEENIQQLLKNLEEIKVGESYEDVVTTGWFNSVRSLLYALASGMNFRKGANTFIRRGPGWIMISSGAVGRNIQNISRPDVAFGLRDASEIEEGDEEITHKIRVCYGTVTADEGTWVSDGFTEGDNPPFIIDDLDGDTGYIYISIDVEDDTGIVSAINDPEVGSDIPDNTDTRFYLVLGSFSITDDVFSISSMELGAQSFILCGGIVPEWGPA